MTFNYLGDLLKIGHGVTIHGPTLKVYPHIGACAESEMPRINVIAGSGYHTDVQHSL